MQYCVYCIYFVNYVIKKEKSIFYKGETIMKKKLVSILMLIAMTATLVTGCDIAGAGIHGKPIKAIQSGIITTATYQSEYNKAPLLATLYLIIK